MDIPDQLLVGLGAVAASDEGKNFGHDVLLSEHGAAHRGQARTGLQSGACGNDCRQVLRGLNGVQGAGSSVEQVVAWTHPGPSCSDPFPHGCPKTSCNNKNEHLIWARLPPACMHASLSACTSNPTHTHIVHMHTPPPSPTTEQTHPQCACWRTPCGPGVPGSTLAWP
jgi:hypothetical protein